MSSLQAQGYVIPFRKKDGIYKLTRRNRRIWNEIIIIVSQLSKKVPYRHKGSFQLDTVDDLLANDLSEHIFYTIKKNQVAGFIRFNQLYTGQRGRSKLKITSTGKRKVRGKKYEIMNCCLRAILVFPEFQGEGVASELIQHMEKEIKLKEGILYYVELPNNASKKFFRRIGALPPELESKDTGFHFLRKATDISTE